MHRDEVRIFRGNVEAHLRWLRRVARFFGVSSRSDSLEADPTPMKVITQLDYGRDGKPSRVPQWVVRTGVVFADVLAMALALGLIVCLVVILIMIR